MGKGKSIQEDAVENYRVGFEVTMNLWINEGKILWSKVYIQIP